MRTFFLNGKENENAPEGISFEETLKEHEKYVAGFFADGTILLGGPKVAGCGFMVVRSESEEQVREFKDNDPFVKSGLQDYDITEFNMYNCQDPVRYWFG